MQLHGGLNLVTTISQMLTSFGRFISILCTQTVSTNSKWKNESTRWYERL